MDRREKQALDRHITGNYGEDQFRYKSPKGLSGRKLAKEGDICSYQGCGKPAVEYIYSPSRGLLVCEKHEGIKNG